MSAPSAAVRAGPPERIANRYAVDGVLGKGGAAVVYRVTDAVTSREVALKQLLLSATDAKYTDVAALFEREFHMLAQLRHPSIIEVFNYGVEDGKPYYTMELLDGDDLGALSPMPWRDACVLLLDVCSSLALVHSRGLVHRDVTPRNVRRTGRGAKLIDFGAMIPMGPCRTVVGTAPFAAPEVVHRSTLDARTDLFSLGATLYSILTGQLAYPARKFRELGAAWSAQPRPPSNFVADLPPALDTLVLSMISIDPASRPRSAAEVMQRLAAIAGVQRVESGSVSQAYLTTPLLVARERALLRFRKRLIRSLRGRGGAVLITGAPGVGRSRLLDACALDATIKGATVLRAAAGAAEERPFAVVQALLEQLIDELPEIATATAEALPEVTRCVLATEPGSWQSQEIESGPGPALRVTDLARASVDLRELQAALNAWLLKISEQVRLVLAIDDFDRVDAPSAGLLAGLCQAAGSKSLLLVATAVHGAPAAAAVAFELFAKHSSELALEPLERSEVQALLASVFGDVPGLGPLGGAVHRLSHGSPRECMALSQHLVASGVITYANGTWRLPVRLDEAALPRRLEDALGQSIAALDPLARRLVECQALAGGGRFERADYVALAGGSDELGVDDAIEQLAACKVLLRDGAGHVLAHGGWRSLLTTPLTPEQRRTCHRSLARFSELRGKHVVVVVEHLLSGDAIEDALDRLRAYLEQAQSDGMLVLPAELDAEAVAALYARALDHAERLGRSPRELATLRRFLTMTSTVADERYYFRVAPEWLRQLEQDSGLAAWRALDPALPAQERLSRALGEAIARYNGTPEAGRVYRFDEAIRHLVHFVGISIAIGSRAWDERLLESLPELLEPFAPLSKLAHAIWQNALATREVVRARPERGRARWIDVLAQLDDVPPSEQQYVDVVRKAVAFGLGLVETRMGLASARRWFDLLEGDLLQGVSALYMRRVLRLQQGDREGAERYRRQAELLAAQINVRPLFTVALNVELAAQALASDLIALKQTIDRIEPLAEQHAGWAPYRHLAEGQYQRLRGDLTAAWDAFERCIACCRPEDASGPRLLWPFLGATAEYVASLAQGGRAAEAKRRGLHALEICARLEIAVAADPVVRAVALAEAKLGEHDAADRRLKALIDAQQRLGVTGLNLGASYEAGARIAIASGDAAAFERYAELTAREYRHGEGSSLAVHYEHLMSEARRAGIVASAKLGDFASTATATSFGRRSQHVASVVRSMRTAEDRAERAAQALKLLCEAKGATGGHLWLCGDVGLELAASLGGIAASAGTLGRARAYLDAEIERTEGATVVAPALDEGELLTSGWNDTDGQAYRSVPLTTELDGEVVYAGIALLCLGTRTPDQTGVLQLVSAIGQYLIEAGDVRPLRPDG